MITISLCMIVRNEENSLAHCLASVEGIADEIIIVDTGSTDRTKEIARSFGARLYDFEWIEDFAAARNYSFSQATKEYVLWLDADDTIQEKDRKLFKQLKKTLPPGTDTVTMAYHLSFDGEGNVTSSLRRNRLVKRERNFQWIGPVHEYLAVGGASFTSDVAITHKKDKAYTDRNLRIYRKRQAAGEDFSPRDLYYFANELMDHAIYAEAVEYYEKFLATGQGWIEDNFRACLKLADCLNRLGDREKELQALFRTLSYDIPRAEFCCRLGAYWLEKQQYREAIYWYECAVHLPPRTDSMGMTNPAYSTWLPRLQLCLCYDRLGQYRKANHYNELALQYNPSHPSMLHNRTYLEGLLGPKHVKLNRQSTAGH